MKNVLKFWGIIAITAVIGFSIAACDDGSNGSESDGLPSGTTFSVKGTFGESSKFSLANAESYARSVVDAESYAIKGELEDGEIVFRLTGTYDPVARNYTASAASSIIRYSISGSFNQAGVSLGSTATVLVRDSTATDEWISFTYEVKEEAVTISGSNTAEEYDGGIPSWARGWWRASGLGWKAKLLISQWTIFQEQEINFMGFQSHETFNASVIEATEKGSYWDLIVGYPVYIGTRAQVEAAAAAYLAGKGLTGVKLDENPHGPDWLWSTNWYYVYEVGEHEFYQYRFNIVENFEPGNWENSLYNQLQNALNDYFYENDFDVTKAQFETFIANWLSSKGITATKLSVAPPEVNFVDLPDSIYYFYDEKWNDIQWGYGGDWFALTAAQRKAIEDAQMQWWSTHFLEKYLIELGLDPETRYAKSQATFSNNNTRMALKEYITGTQEDPIWEWETVAEARAATIINDDSDSQVTLTR